VKYNSIQFKIIAICLTLIQAIFPVASAYGDSLARYDTASYWVTHRESDLTEYWGLPDGRISFPDGNSRITYKAGRTIGGHELKMYETIYLREQIEFSITADGIIQQYAVGAYTGASDVSHPWLIFVGGVVTGVVLVYVGLVIALRSGGSYVSGN